MAFFLKYVENFWQIMLELGPWLVFGLFLAGLLHVALPEGFVKRHFGGRGFRDVLHAVVLGIPMPLCSCGVIPTAIGLRRDGASKGASMGFLISTPQTGVDSILVCAGFLGWPLALFKVVCALFSGMIGGLLVNKIDKARDIQDSSTKNNCCSNHGGTTEKTEPDSCCHKSQEKSQQKILLPKIKALFAFGFGDLFRDIYIWLLIGVAVAALITTFVPANFFAKVEWMQGIFGMLIVLAVSIPMYVCSNRFGAHGRCSGRCRNDAGGCSGFSAGRSGYQYRNDRHGAQNIWPHRTTDISGDGSFYEHSIRIAF